MKSTLVHESRGHQRTFVLVFEPGDEVVGALTAFANAERLASCSMTGIGAFSDAVVGYFDWTSKDYQPLPIREQVELLSLNGDIVLQGAKRKLHAHVVLGKSDGSAHGGHLLSAHVRPTLELVLVESPAYLTRRKDPETGVALIQLPSKSPARRSRNEVPS